MLEPRTQTEIYNDMVEWIIANTSQITNFNQGGVVRTFLEAVAWQIERTYRDAYLAYRNYSMQAVYSIFGFERKTALPASVNVVFSADEAVLADLTIAVGTVVESATGDQYETTEIATILTGNTASNSVSVTAKVAGQRSIGIGDIARIVTPLAGVDSVTNSAIQTFEGRDRESDTEMLVRFQKYVQGLARSTKPGIEAGAELVDGVFQAQADDSVTPGTVVVYVDDGTGSASVALLAAVEAQIEGDGTEDNPGYRAAGISVTIDAPTKVIINIEQTLQFLPGTDTAAGEVAVEAAEAEYINSLAFGIDMIRAQLSAYVIARVPELRNILFTAPSTDITVENGELAKVGTFTSTSTIFIGDI